MKTIDFKMNMYAFNELEDTFMPLFLKNTYNSIIYSLENIIKDYPASKDVPDYIKENFSDMNEVREATEVLMEYYGVEIDED